MDYSERGFDYEGASDLSSLDTDYLDTTAKDVGVEVMGIAILIILKKSGAYHHFKSQLEN